MFELVRMRKIVFSKLQYFIVFCFEFVASSDHLGTYNNIAREFYQTLEYLLIVYKIIEDTEDDYLQFAVYRRVV